MGAAAARPIDARQECQDRNQCAARPPHAGADRGAHPVSDGGGQMMRKSTGSGGARVAASKGVPFSANPVLATRLPAWRSRVVLFALFAAFLALAGRALWLQGLSTDFLQK